MPRTGIRASAIIIRNNKILLIHRKKEGKEYWVLPGGGIEEGESGEETIKREVKEETNIDVEKCKLVFKAIIDGKRHPFYSCEVRLGEVKLGGPEIKRHAKDNWYHPEWVKLADVPQINLIPEQVKQELTPVHLR